MPGLLPRMLPVVFALVACSPGDRAGSPAGPPVVRHLQLTEDLRLDADAEDFSTVRRVHIGPMREIAVSLPQDFQVRLYDSTGVRLGALGRKGKGPGEFEELGEIGWVGDHVFAGDRLLSRVTIFSTDGTVVGTRSTPQPFLMTRIPNAGPDSLFSFFLPYTASPDNSLIGQVFLTQPDSKGLPVVGARAFVQLLADGSARLVARTPSYREDHLMVEIDGRQNIVPLALQPQLSVAHDGSRIAFLTADQSAVEGGTFSVIVVDANGDTLLHRSYPYTGEPIPGSVRDSALAAMGAQLAERQRFQAAAKDRMPAVYSPVQRILLGLDDTVWITLRATTEGTPALVLNERGDPIGTFLLPPRSRIQQASRTHVWLTETDEFNLASVVRYRVSGW